MQDIPKEQIIKRFQILPENLQNEIFSEKSADTIIKHCALRDVPNDKMPIVGRLSTRVLLGYLRPELFALEIQKETGMDMQKAQLIAQDLDAEIFSAVRLELKKLYPPTIQTPTVQSWKAEARPNLQPTTYNLQPKPRYVIPIPEKFLKQTTDNKQLTTNNQTQKTTTDIQQTEKKETSVIPSEAKSELAERGISPGSFVANAPQDDKMKEVPENKQPTTYNLQPDFKPIVPLPTFIQTQFKSAQKPAEAANQNKEQKGMIDDPNIKSFVDRFKTSQTQKPKPPAESPYREKI